MPDPIIFDTHAYVKELKAVGFTEEQAEVLSSRQARALEESLATKKDIELLRRDVKELEFSLRRDISEMKSETIKWVAGMPLAQAALIAALVKLL
ncbi:MAG: hypothetical protein RBS57_04880 [Desulforhabdus sp.]|jgi:hypothetical protein|nr:hypothetical protein [Desulforhabdus sp.]